MNPIALYITVSDMTSGLEFYARVFDRKPAHIDERYSWFEFDEFSFGLLDKKFEDREVVYGNASALCFHVENIETEYQRLKNIVPVIDPALLELPTVRVFQFKDHDGNQIEIFQRR